MGFPFAEASGCAWSCQGCAPSSTPQTSTTVYICPCLGRGGASFYLSPTVSADTAAASNGFESITDTITSLATMNRLIMAANDGSLDDSSPQDIKAVAGLEDVDSAVDPKSPSKRVRLVDMEDDGPEDDGSSPTTARWRTAERELPYIISLILYSRFDAILYNDNDRNYESCSGLKFSNGKWCSR